MQYDLYFYTKLGSKETEEKIYQIIKRIMKKNKEKKPKVHAEWWSISTTYFSLSFPDFPEDRVEVDFYDFLEKEQDIKINFYISIQFGGKTIEQGMPFFFEIMSELLIEFQGDALFVKVEGSIIFKKQGRELLINNHFEDYQEELYKKETLGLLGIPYTYDDDVKVL